MEETCKKKSPRRGQPACSTCYGSGWVVVKRDAKSLKRQGDARAERRRRTALRIQEERTSRSEAEQLARLDDMLAKRERARLAKRA